MFASSSSGKCAVREIGDVLPNGRKTFFGQSVGRAMLDYANGVGRRWGDV